MRIFWVGDCKFRCPTHRRSHKMAVVLSIVSRAAECDRATPMHGTVSMYNPGSTQAHTSSPVVGAQRTQQASSSSCRAETGIASKTHATHEHRSSTDTWCSRIMKLYSPPHTTTTTHHRQIMASEHRLLSIPTIRSSNVISSIVATQS